MSSLRCASIAAAVLWCGACSNGVCKPETDQGFCVRLGRDCGSVTAFDNCNALRTVPSCGECTLPQTCGGGGTQNVCGPLGAAVDAGTEVSVPVSVSLLTACGGSDPMQGVAFLRYRLVNAVRCDTTSSTCLNAVGSWCQTDADCGFGTQLQQQVVASPAGTVTFVQLATGETLQVVVAGFTKNPSDAQAQIVSFGHSGDFTLSPASPGPKQVSVRLRRVEAFSPVCDDAGNRVQLSTPRAAHTATVLSDGRVLVAGGFDTVGVSAGNLKNPSYWNYKETVEIFDPQTNALVSAPSMARLGVSTPRAFHAAVKLASGQVLVTGGEYSGATHAMATRTEPLLFDPASDGTWGPMPGTVKRSRHSATLEQSGVCFLFGGLVWGDTSQPANTPIYSNYFEWFDPANAIHQEDQASWGQANTAVGAAATPVYAGKYVLVAGGSIEDGAANAGKMNQATGIRFYNFVNGKMTQYGSAASGPAPRGYVAVGGAGSRYLVIGGFTDLDAANYWNLFPTTPSAITDVVNLKTVTTVAGPPLDTPRGHICAVALADGRVLVTGGRGGQAAVGAVGNVGIFTDDGNTDPHLAFTYAPAAPLTDARFFHSCTLLADGSVLVAGGVQESGASFTTLSSMEIFVPAPVD